MSDYARTEAALKLKETIAKKARDRQLAGNNQYSLPSNLSEGSIDTRKEISELSGVSIGNVSKVEYIQRYAPDDVKEALRTGVNGVSINKKENMWLNSCH